MKYVDIENLDGLSGRRLEEDEEFSFRCHPGIGCFNKCCRNINLFLYPYDVIRLKNGLGISSDQFLDEYVDVVLRKTNFFPDVVLRMGEDEKKSCIFLNESGCRAYENRPDTCRHFPVEQGMMYDETSQKYEPVHFFKPPAFCLGPNEEETWTPGTWARDQERGRYNQWMIRWMEIKRLFQSDPWGAEGPDGPKARMAFMATYNMDTFRDFVLNSSFLKRYRINSDLKQKVKKNDEALLKLGFAWVRLFVWGMKSKTVQPR